MLTSEEIKFIKAHQHEDVNVLRLKFSTKKELNYPLLINQIESIKKAEKKLPELCSKINFILPPASNLAQASSEITAKYKASIVKGKKGLDLTGGAGIDAIYMSESFKEYIYVEPNEDLFNLASKNLKLLNLNIHCELNYAENYIKKNQNKFDVIYIDPSRRKNTKKTVFLEDYTPNIVDLQNDLFKLTDIIIVKTSPLLDVKNAISKLKNVNEVHIISVKNEVKEVLYILKSTKKEVIEYKTIHFNSEKTMEEWYFTSTDLKKEATFSLPKMYIYEPNASIMKSGAFMLVSFHFNIFKLHKNSHLYTSENLIKDFPGRVFECIASHQFSKKELCTFKKANISTRNFPLTVEEIRKKTKIKEGGKIYLFATTIINNKHIILSCKKID